MTKKIKLVGITSNYRVDETDMQYGLVDGVETTIERLRYSERVIDSCQVDGITAVPVMIPPLGAAMFAVVEKLDGIIFTGSGSNVHPDNYGGTTPRADNLEDRNRDDTTLPLFKLAMARGLSILCICRGTQELNVAMGGTLFQHIEELPGKMDHRYKYEKGNTYDEGFRAVHDVTIQDGGVLEKLYARIEPGKKKWFVNSAHGQGVDKLAPNLLVEAYADDGVVEAVSCPAYTKQGKFLMALQWHPEVSVVIDQPHNKILFQEFARHL